MDKVLSLLVTIAIDYFGIAFESVKAQKVAPVGELSRTSRLATTTVIADVDRRDLVRRPPHLHSHEHHSGR